jgi:hypothetical protein
MPDVSWTAAFSLMPDVTAQLQATSLAPAYLIIYPQGLSTTQAPRRWTARSQHGSWLMCMHARLALSKDQARLLPQHAIAASEPHHIISCSIMACIQLQYGQAQHESQERAADAKPTTDPAPRAVTLAHRTACAAGCN